MGPYCSSAHRHRPMVSGLETCSVRGLGALAHPRGRTRRGRPSDSESPRSQEDLIPPETRQALVDRRRAQVIFTLRLTAELFRILDRFTSEGIGALAVKGPVLAVAGVWRPGDARLWRPGFACSSAGHRRATELMSAAGYEAAVPLSAIDGGKNPRQYLFFNPAIETHRRAAQRSHPALFSAPAPPRGFFRAAHPRAPRCS